MLAAVVPIEVLFGDAEGEAVVEDAFEVLRLQIVFVDVPDEKKEVGGSCLGSPTMTALLPRASAPTASQVGICDALVEYDDVEEVGLGLEVLGDGGRAHQHAGRELGKEFGDLCEQLLGRHAAHIPL